MCVSVFLLNYTAIMASQIQEVVVTYVERFQEKKHMCHDVHTDVDCLAITVAQRN
jgi:hypothetical protein